MLCDLLHVNSQNYATVIEHLSQNCKIIKKYLCIPSANITQCYATLYKRFGEGVLFKVNSYLRGIEILTRESEILQSLEKLKHSFSPVPLHSVEEQEKSEEAKNGSSGGGDLDASASSSSGGGLTNASFHHFGSRERDSEEKRVSFHVFAVSREGQVVSLELMWVCKGTRTDLFFVSALLNTVTDRQTELFCFFVFVEIGGG